MVIANMNTIKAKHRSRSQSSKKSKRVSSSRKPKTNKRGVMTGNRGKYTTRKWIMTGGRVPEVMETVEMKKVEEGPVKLLNSTLKPNNTKSGLIVM